MFINIHIVEDPIRTKITYQKKFVVVALLKFGKKSLEKQSEYSFMYN